MTKILNIKLDRDKNENEMKVCQLQGGGETIISIWVNSKYDSEIYPLVEVGKEVEIIQDGKFWKIKPESLGIEPKKNWKGGAIKEAQERKASQITTFQKHKEDSIKMAGLQRDTVLIVTTFYPEFATELDKEKLILEKLLEWKGKIKDVFEQPF